MSFRSAFAGTRSVVFWIHLALGAAAGLVILVLSLSGMLLGYERQLIERFDGTPAIAVAPGVARLPLDALLERAAVPARSVASIQLRAGATSAVLVRTTDPRQLPLLLNPYTAAALPLPTQTPIRRAFAQVRQWHLFLGAPEGAWRSSTKPIAGAAMLLLLALIPLGLVLWWPRQWTRAALSTALLFRLKLRGRARDFNWHHSVGIWFAAPLFVLALTAVFIAYQWPTQWLDRWLGASGDAGAPPLVVKYIPGESASPSRLLASIEAAHPAWTLVTMNMAVKSGAAVQVTVAEGNTFRPDLRATMLLHPVSGAVLRETTYASLDTSRRWRSWVRNTHTGEAFGLAGQTVATAASGAGALLAWTGLALAVRRLRKWWARGGGTGRSNSI